MEKSSVRFGYADRVLTLKSKRGIQKFVADIIRKESGKPCTLQYVFCSDEYLHGINVSFLKHDTYTDIITFDLSEAPNDFIHGEIYISIDRVVENGQKLGTEFENEILRVIFHGALHLCGFTDKSKSYKVIMNNKEEEYLSLYFKP